MRNLLGSVSHVPMLLLLSWLV